jgi:PAS domain S-box-containing protein
MTQEDDDQHLTEENQRLRLRVLELEQQLADFRSGGVRSVSGPMGGASDEASISKESAAQRAIAGFFEQPLVMLFIADLVEGRFLRVNQKACEVLGYSEKELLETSFLDRVHPDDHLRTMREMEWLVAGEKTANFRNRHRDVHGDYRVFEWTAIADADRELCYAMAVEVTG